jgi:SAM-dependent methyltransferase
VRVEALAIQTALRQHAEVPDELFDRQYPRMQRYRSSVHWTPIDVAMRIAQLLSAAPDGQVLDVGAGVGKACIVGALTTNTVWFGVERDIAMIRAARTAARRLGVDHRTRFVSGEALALDWSAFGGFYLYNPFAEALFDNRIDPAVRQATYRNEVAAVSEKLRATRPGTRVVTYHGFGGEIPEGFELVECHRLREDEVCLWIRRRVARRGVDPFPR